MPTYKSSEPDNRPDYVEPGDYTLEVINAAETVSQRGSDMIELKLRITPSGVVMFDHLVFTENAFWKIDAFRAASGETVTPEQEVEIRADDLIGRTARARLVVEEYKGRKRNKVTAWLAPKVADKTAGQAADKKGGNDDNQPF